MFRNTLLKSVRSFSTTPIRKNAVQDLYIKELKAFKPQPLSTKDAQEATKPWNTPIVPKVPEAEITADQLNAYESSEVEVAAQTQVGEEVVSEEWFVLEEPEDNHH